MGTAHLLCMCVSGWVLKPDDSALPGSNNEELPACKINSPQCVRVGLRILGEDISCFNTHASPSVGFCVLHFLCILLPLPQLFILRSISDE